MEDYKKIFDFMSDHVVGYYELIDNLEVGEDEGDAISQIERELNNADNVSAIQSFLTENYNPKENDDETNQEYDFINSALSNRLSILSEMDDKGFIRGDIDLEYFDRANEDRSIVFLHGDEDIKAKGVIFLNPLYNFGSETTPKYLIADEYLSGNVREKLQIAKNSAKFNDDFNINVEALERVQPKDLTASEISVRLGATWIPPEIYEQFIYEFLGTPVYMRHNIKVNFAAYTGQWNIEGKSYDRGSVKANKTYGTGRINAYKIIEETLNLKDVRVIDYLEDSDGKKTAVLNKKETAIALSKQELIKQGFQDWIWNDPERRERLCKIYNEKFNSLRPREYDGSHLVFSGMNPEIQLREHQRNAIAHIIYGGNTLLAHAVGAGKSATRS